MIEIKNADIVITPGCESRHVLSHESWPRLEEQTPVILIANQICLRVPAYCEGKTVVVELNAMDTCVPPSATAYAVTGFFDGQPVRLAQGFIRRKN